MEIIRVGMADLKAARNPCMITTLGLGSCIGIALYDPITKISGLAHIMLPESSLIKNNLNLAKFADTAIDKLIEDMQILGAQRKLYGPRLLEVPRENYMGQDCWRCPNVRL